MLKQKSDEGTHMITVSELAEHLASADHHDLGCPYTNDILDLIADWRAIRDTLLLVAMDGQIITHMLKHLRLKP